LSQLLSKVTDISRSYSSDVQCIHLAAVRRTLKMCCCRSRLFLIVAVKTLAFHKIVYRHTWDVVWSLVTVLLQMFCWFWQLN